MTNSSTSTTSRQRAAGALDPDETLGDETLDQRRVPAGAAQGVFDAGAPPAGPQTLVPGHRLAGRGVTVQVEGVRQREPSHVVQREAVRVPGLPVHHPFHRPAAGQHVAGPEVAMGERDRDLHPGQAALHGGERVQVGGQGHVVAEAELEGGVESGRQLGQVAGPAVGDTGKRVQPPAGAGEVGRHRLGVGGVAPVVVGGEHRPADDGAGHQDRPAQVLDHPHRLGDGAFQRAERQRGQGLQDARLGADLGGGGVGRRDLGHQRGLLVARLEEQDRHLGVGVLGPVEADHPAVHRVHQVRQGGPPPDGLLGHLVGHPLDRSTGHHHSGRLARRSSGVVARHSHRHLAARRARVQAFDTHGPPPGGTHSTDVLR